MSLRTNESEVSTAPGSSWTTWMWLSLAALAVVATVFGFLHAGRSFWQLSSTLNASGFLQQV